MDFSAQLGLFGQIGDFGTQFSHFWDILGSNSVILKNIYHPNYVMLKPNYVIMKPNDVILKPYMATMESILAIFEPILPTLVPNLTILNPA